MDNTFFSFIDFGSSTWGFSAVLNGLVDENVTFNIVYEAIVGNPTYVILSESTKERKLKILNKMIKHFESLEEYEKCANLIRIKKEIE